MIVKTSKSECKELVLIGRELEPRARATKRARVALLESVELNNNCYFLLFQLPSSKIKMKNQDKESRE